MKTGTKDDFPGSFRTEYVFNALLTLSELKNEFQMPRETWNQPVPKMQKGKETQLVTFSGSSEWGQTAKI